MITIKHSPCNRTHTWRLRVSMSSESAYAFGLKKASKYYPLESGFRTNRIQAAEAAYDFIVNQNEGILREHYGDNCERCYFYDDADSDRWHVRPIGAFTLLSQKITEEN